MNDLERNPFDRFVDDLFSQVKRDVLNGAAETLQRAAGGAVKATRKGVVTAALGSLPASAIVVLDRKVRLDVAATIAAVVGRKGHPEPEVGSANVPAGRYRAITVLIPEE